MARAVTVWVSTARKAPARNAGVGSTTTMRRVILITASQFTAAGAKHWSGHLQSVRSVGAGTDLIRITLYRADELLRGARLARLPVGPVVKGSDHHHKWPHSALKRQRDGRGVRRLRGYTSPPLRGYNSKLTDSGGVPKAAYGPQLDISCP